MQESEKPDLQKIIQSYISDTQFSDRKPRAHDLLFAAIILANAIDRLTTTLDKKVVKGPSPQGD